jgi:hypothetical protein
MGMLTLLLLVPFVFIFVLLLPVLAILDILKSKFEGNDALLMLLIVIFIPFGAILYFILAPSRKVRIR